jgi:acetylornithine deacetylase/succinyl-diaminopimelate desuccinylase-like protein
MKKEIAPKKQTFYKRQKEILDNKKFTPLKTSKVQQARLVRTLQDLVRIPSHESCDKISRHVAGEIRKIGIKPEVDSDGNIIARIGSGQTLLLNAHMDTVGISGYRDPYSGKVRGNRLYGRGSTDDKSGVAAMLEILRTLKENPPRNQVIFAFTVGEEEGDEDTDGAYRVARKIKATHGIVLESAIDEKNNLEVCIGCKGRFVYRIDVLGRATHSGKPWTGRNAIYTASELIERLKGFKSTSMKIPGYGKVSSCLSVTQIEAREGSNIIPGKCSLTVDYRALPGEGEPEIRRNIQRICKRVLGKSYKISPVNIPKEGYIETDAEFPKLCKKAIRETGMNPLAGFSAGWIDGTVFKRAGMTTINMGPGTLGQAHRNPEYCWIPGLVKGTQAILNLIRGWDAQ